MLFCHGAHRGHGEEERAMQHRCPICKKPTDSEVHTEFPFCSERCKLQDLGNWATEKYVVSEPIFSEDDDERDDSPKPNDAEH
jgi:endogenous inhibitor of DNA gyrase (YacG/DUF329 family)